MDLLSSLLPLAAIFAVFWLLLIRPQQRRMREQTERVNSLQVGTRVMTASGIYGTVRHLGTTQAVVEIAPGVEMTIAKAAINQIVRAEDEEFEYEDADDDADAPSDTPDDRADEPTEPTPADGADEFPTYPRPGDAK